MINKTIYYVLKLEKKKKTVKSLKSHSVPKSSIKIPLSKLHSFKDTNHDWFVRKLIFHNLKVKSFFFFYYFEILFQPHPFKF